MLKHSMTRTVIIAFIIYVVLTGIIMLGFYTDTKTLVAEQDKLTEDNRELNEKYEDLLDMIEEYKEELGKRNASDPVP